MKVQTPGLEPPAPEVDMDASSKTMTQAGLVQQPVAEKRVWNTKNLGLRLASDFVSGACAATLVAPVITIIDKFVPSPIPFAPCTNL
jgi:hypothetical protein